MGKLYVGNLPYSVNNDELKAHFEKVGEVKSATVIMDRETGRSKGFGFVEMDKSADAISELNETSFNGRNINVSEARPQKERGPSGGNRDRRGNGNY
jgi:RNA recognition motif-containing protein